MLALAEAGVPITWTPMIPGGRMGPYSYGPFTGRGIGDPDLDPLCNRPLDYDLVIVHTVPEYFPFWTAAEPGRTIIGNTVWETTAIPRHWAPLLNAVDHLLVPCHWNKSVFEQSGVTTPIDVVPHVAADAAETPDDADRDDGDGYVFYTINTWTHRKALPLTVAAFCEAFTASDPTTLVIKTTSRDFTATGLRRRLRPTSAGALRRLVRRFPRPPRVRLITDDLSDAQMRRLHRRGDCYVSLCRGEGWGIGAFDAATYGKPVVMTAFGGQLDYLAADHAYLVGSDLVPVTDPESALSYSPDQRWASRTWRMPCDASATSWLTRRWPGRRPGPAIPDPRAVRRASDRSRSDRRTDQSRQPPSIDATREGLRAVSQQQTRRPQERAGRAQAARCTETPPKMRRPRGREKRRLVALVLHACPHALVGQHRVSRHLRVPLVAPDEHSPLRSPCEPAAQDGQLGQKHAVLPDAQILRKVRRPDRVPPDDAGIDRRVERHERANRVAARGSELRGGDADPAAQPGRPGRNAVNPEGSKGQRRRDRSSGSRHHHRAQPS